MHPPLYLYEAVARGEVPRRFLEQIEREHLEACCSVCAHTIAKDDVRRSRPGTPGWEPPRDRLDALRDALRERGLNVRNIEREARAWVRQAVKLPREVRRDKVAGAYTRYQGPIFCQLLLKEARQRIPGEPAEAESMADAALAANRETKMYQSSAEVEAAGLAIRGNARRALGRLVRAAEDLAAAERLLDHPDVKDPEMPAEVFNYLGSLRKDQGRFEEAANHMHRAATLYGLLRNQEKAARILLNLGTLHYRLHEPHAAVAADQKALALLDPDSEDWLRGYAHYNLAFHLHAAGDTDRAEAELAAHEELLAACGDEVAQHVVWLRARIAWSREDLTAAQTLYTEARQRALDRGITWDAGLVGLELALVHLVRGHTTKVRKLAREAKEIFAAQEVEREVRAALDLLDAAERRDAITRALLEQAIAAVESAAHGRPAAAKR